MINPIVNAQREILGMILKHHREPAARDHFFRLVARYPIIEWHTAAHVLMATVITSQLEGREMTSLSVSRALTIAADRSSNVSVSAAMAEESVCRAAACLPEQAPVLMAALINNRVHRSAELLIRRAHEMLSEPGLDSTDVLTELLEEGARVLSLRERGHGAVRQDDACKQTAAELERQWSGEATSLVLRTQWPALNRRLGGGWCTGLNVLASRPKVGKSSLWEQEAIHHARRGEPVIVVTLEMTHSEHLVRMAVRHSGITSRHREVVEGGKAAPRPNVITGEHMTPEDRRHMVRSLTTMAELPIHWHDPRSLQGRSWLAIRGAIDETRAGLDRPVHLVIIDCLGQIEVPKGFGRADQALGSLSVAMTSWALKEGLALILVHHLNRALEREASTKRSDDGKQSTRFRRPRMSDIKEAGQLEQDAGCIVMPHRPSASGAFDAQIEEEGAQPGMMEQLRRVEECEIIVVGRKCPGGTVATWWQGESLSWFERDTSKQTFNF